MIEGRIQPQSARVKSTTTRRALLFAAGAAGLMASSFSKRANALSTKETKAQETLLGIPYEVADPCVRAMGPPKSDWSHGLATYGSRIQNLFAGRAVSESGERNGI